MSWWRRLRGPHGPGRGPWGTARRVAIWHLTGTVMHVPRAGPAAIRGIMRRWVIDADGITRTPDQVGVHVVGVPESSVSFLARSQLSGRTVCIERIRTVTWRRRTTVRVGDPSTVPVPLDDEPPLP